MAKLTQKVMPSIVFDVFQFLNKNTEYVVLRNYEGLPNKNKSRDIDILISRKEFNKIRLQLLTLFSEYGYIITCFESERIYTYVCGRIENSECKLVQFDFFFHTSAYGVILLDIKDVLSVRQFNGHVYYLPKEYEFLDKYLYLKYIGAQYPSKYAAIEFEMRDNTVLNEILKLKFNIDSYTTLRKMSTSVFRYKVLRYNIKYLFLPQIVNFGRFCINWIKNTFSVKGFSLGFTGPDGSGKTTVINKVISELNATYSSINLYHFRPTLFGNLSDVAHSVGIKKVVDREYDKPHRGRKTGVLNSVIRLLYYSVDYIIGYKKVRKALFQRNIVIFDRYYTDIICDSYRSRIYLSHKFLYWFGKLFIPSLDYNILLTASIDTILDRKRELDEIGICIINDKIDYLSTKKGYKKILNERTPEDAATEILTHIFECQHMKNLKTIN